jgi:hypothetical protein
MVDVPAAHRTRRIATQHTAELLLPVIYIQLALHAHGRH